MLGFDGPRKSYGTRRVLDDVGFAVAPGSMFGFCGAERSEAMAVAETLAVRGYATSADATKDLALEPDLRTAVERYPSARAELAGDPYCHHELGQLPEHQRGDVDRAIAQYRLGAGTGDELVERAVRELED